MKTADFNKLRRSIEKSLDAGRFEHTLGVTYTATSLAMCHGGDVRRAQIAGLLHDCARNIDNQKKISICEKHNIEINEVERKNPFLLHAKAGSYLAMQKYGIRDEDIIQAILNHTTGRPGMSLLEKIIYVADYIEPGRKKAPNLAAVRKEAFHDLDKALLMILEDTLAYLDAMADATDPMTRKTYEFYQNTLKNEFGTETDARQD